MIRKKNMHNAVLNENNYRIIIQLYYLNKAEKKSEARLPLHDVRRGKVRKIIINEDRHIISFRKALLKIAALW
jgi:hypothetical protein